MRTRCWLTAAVAALLLCGACKKRAEVDRPLVEKPPVRPDVLAEATAGQRMLALDLLKLRARDAGLDKNMFLSPFSISAALSMTAAGARGETRTQMDTALRLVPGDGAHAVYAALHNVLLATRRPGAELRVANRIYVEQSFGVQPAMLTVTRERYGADAEAVDFRAGAHATRTAINAWVAQRTNERIKDLLPPDSVTSSTRMVLVNAVYFLGTWLTRFDPAATRDEPFNTAAGERPAKMMHAALAAEYADDEDAQWLRLRYRRDDLAMLIALPRAKAGIGAFVAGLDLQRFDDARGRLAAHDSVHVTLPRFRIEDGEELSARLRQLGMKDALDCGDGSRTDLSGIGGKPGELCISAVFHRGFVAVDEAGTEAAAATAVVVDSKTAAVRPPPPVFVADHPFVFVIEHVPTGAPLFIGVLAAPAAS